MAKRRQRGAVQAVAKRGRARAAAGGVPAGFREAVAAGQRVVFAEDLAADLEALGWLEPGGFERIGGGGARSGSGRGETRRHELPRAGVTILVRDVLHGGLLGGFLRSALHSPERAFRELAVTAALREAGAPVPRPALAAARRTGPLWRARVATVFEPDAPDVVAFLAGDPDPDRILRAARACGRAIRRFHDAGGRHADLHVKNLLIRDPHAKNLLIRDPHAKNLLIRDPHAKKLPIHETGEEFEAVIVDLDGAGCGEPPDAARRMRELARLYRSALKRGLGDRIDLEAHRALLHAYVGEDAALGAALSRHWPRERRRVAVHALGYRKGEP